MRSCKFLYVMHPSLDPLLFFRSYTNVKVSLIQAGVSPLTLTAMDSGFMFTYAGGSFITGSISRAYYHHRLQVITLLLQQGNLVTASPPWLLLEEDFWAPPSVCSSSLSVPPLASCRMLLCVELGF